MTIVVGAREARQRFADLLGRVGYGKEVAIVERSGKPMMALIPIELYDRLAAEREARFQVLDMVGNVWEWVLDWYQSDYYAVSPARNPAGPALGDNRALRGGSWNNIAADVRAADRHGVSPGIRIDNLGFRCVR